MSATAVINLINGLFGTDYPLDSKITYNWTEFEDDNLKKILADTIITINDRYSYHLEAQIEKDNTIVFRVFEYGFSHANRNRYIQAGKYDLYFPRPIVIYLYYEGDVPEKYRLTLHFESDSEERTFDYHVPVMKLQDISAKELNDRKMIILIPFHILKFRKIIKNGVGEEQLLELKNLLHNDIIGSIDANLKVKNITIEDALKLKLYTQKLCDYLYASHKEMGVLKDMTDESFMTDIDILCKEHEEEIEKKIELLMKLEEDVAKKDESLQKLEEDVAKKDESLQKLEEDVAKKDESLQKLEEDVAKKDESLQKLEEDVAKKDESLQKLEEDVAKKDEFLQKAQKKRLQVICKKIQKGKMLDEIAEDLEEDIMDISPIYEVVIQHGPDYNIDMVYEAVKDVI